MCLDLDSMNFAYIIDLRLVNRDLDDPRHVLDPIQNRIFRMSEPGQRYKVLDSSQPNPDPYFKNILNF